MGSLEDRGLGKTNRYWHSVGKSAADVAVTLETGDSTCTAKIAKGEVIAVPLAARPKVEVPRRSQILRLIEARPADRYAEIDRFIDVSGLETSEATVRELIRNLGSNRDTAVARVQENEDAIQQFWESAGKPGKDPIKWAEQESARDGSALPAEVQAVGTLRANYQRIADYPAKIMGANQILDAARTAAAAPAKQLEGLLANAAEGAGDLVGILEAAKPYLEKHPHPAHCPLCESVEKVGGLRERVESRIGQFTSLQKATREKKTADQTVQAAGHKILDLKNDLALDSKAFDEAKTAHTWHQNVPLPKQPCPSDFTALAEWIKSTAHLSTEWQKVETAIQAQNQFVNTLKQALKTYKTNAQAQKDLDQLLPRLDRSLEIIVEERRKFTDGVLQAIAASVRAERFCVLAARPFHRARLYLRHDRQPQP